MKVINNLLDKNINRYSIIVVGAGLTGSVLAKELCEAGENVLVIERRNNIGGNLFDSFDADGDYIQYYGPHCFHTNDERIVNYISKVCDWEPYKVKCSVYMKGKLTPSPFNFKTIDQYFDLNTAKLIKDNLKSYYLNKEAVSIVEMLNSNNDIVRKYAKFLFDSDYSLYTAKQWGISPSMVSTDVLARVPVLLNYDEQYFYDKYQFMPKKGFNDFISNMLNCSVDVLLGHDFNSLFSVADGKIRYKGTIFNGKIIYTGPIDSLFRHKYGILPYRSLRFEYYKNKYLPCDSAIIAYPEARFFTRVTNYNELIKNKSNRGIFGKEYPLKYNPSENEPYYPISSKANDLRFKKYVDELKKYPQILICGRLAEYKYINMDETILNTSKFLHKHFKISIFN